VSWPPHTYTARRLSGHLFAALQVVRSFVPVEAHCALSTLLTLYSFESLCASFPVEFSSDGAASSAAAAAPAAAAGSYSSSAGIEAIGTFDGMGLKEELLRGIYAYGQEGERKREQRRQWQRQAAGSTLIHLFDMLSLSIVLLSSPASFVL
jgi:hypothetical protein